MASPPHAWPTETGSPSTSAASTTVDTASSVMTTAVLLHPMRDSAAKVRLNATAVATP